MARDVAPAALRLAQATGERARASISSAAAGLGRVPAAGADALAAESCAAEMCAEILVACPRFSAPLSQLQAWAHVFCAGAAAILAGPCPESGPGLVPQKHNRPNCDPGPVGLANAGDGGE